MDRGILANDALLKGNSSRIIDLHGSCRHVVELNGSEDRIEFYSNNIMFRPKIKISILLWIKPKDFDIKKDCASLFIVTGMHPDPFTSYMRIDRFSNGSIRCQHRNENGSYIFNIISDSEESKINYWTHIACTYVAMDSDKGEVRLYINGSLKYRSSGSGYISKDWDGYAGLGNDNAGRSFIGYMDEIMLFDRILTPSEVNDNYEKCNFEKYYTGETIKSDHGVILSPSYPDLYTGPVEAHWIIRSSNDQLIEIIIEEIKIGNEESCDRSNLIIRELVTGFLIERICGGIQGQKNLVSNSNGISINFESSGEPEGIKFKIKFKKQMKENNSKRQEISRNLLQCIKKSRFYENLKNFETTRLINIGRFPNKDECVYTSCNRYMLNHIVFTNNFCFAVPEYSGISEYFRAEINKIGVRSELVSKLYQNNCEFEAELSNIMLLNHNSIDFIYLKNVSDIESCKKSCCNNENINCSGVIIFDEMCFLFDCKASEYQFRPIFSKETTTIISFKKSVWDNLINIKKNYKKEICEKDFWPKKMIRLNFIDKKIIESHYQFNYFGHHDDLSGCLFDCCINKEHCELSLYVGNDCYGLKCYDLNECNIIGDDKLNEIGDENKLYISNSYLKSMFFIDVV
ncbi:hypothetical protein MXB_1389 [Myxobolus squamalis]|nr:hypothetical protein MXB_1389 [Myxobolus squamalis]